MGIAFPGLENFNLFPTGMFSTPLYQNMELRRYNL